MRIFLWLWLATACAQAASSEFPAAHWSVLTPGQAGLSAAKLEEFRELVGGRGCVVRHGAMVFSWGDPAKSSDVASAFKPLLSTLLFIAIQEGRVQRG
jgi:hypothetical protein